MTTSKKRTRKTQKRPRFTGWSTSDADEIERRRLRGREEAIRIEPLDRADAFYDAFLAHSNGARAFSKKRPGQAAPISKSFWIGAATRYEYSGRKPAVNAPGLAAS